MARRRDGSDQPELDAVGCDGSSRSLFDSNVVGVILGELWGDITQANDAFLDLIGCERSDLPFRWETPSTPVTHAPGASRIEALLQNRTAATGESELVARDGTHIPVLVVVTRRPESGRGYLAFVLDLTRTKKAEKDLSWSRARSKALCDQSPTISLEIDRTGAIMSVNAHGAGVLGYPETGLVGVPLAEIVHEEDRSMLRDLFATTSSDPGRVAACDLRHLRKDGSIVWTRASIRALLDSDGQMFFLLVAEDLTRRRENEERLLHYQTRLRTLTLKLALAGEEERRRIALGLHDDVGHSLALARMKLGAYRQKAGEDFHGELADARELIDHAIQATRALTFDLSSPILYEIGLEPALQSAGERVIESNAIRFVFDADDEPKPLSADVRVVLYRSAEELLHNVVKHARARCVRIDVNRVDDRIHIRVTDDGVGFDYARVGERWGQGHGHGLFSIREQLAAIGGQLDVDSASGRGTVCLLVAPLDSSEQ